LHKSKLAASGLCDFFVAGLELPGSWAIRGGLKIQRELVTPA